MIPPLGPTFEAALRDVGAESPRFRIDAAQRLAEPPPGREDEAAEALRVLFADPVGPVRQTAFESAGELGADTLLPSLTIAFSDEDRGARQSAVLAAGRISPERSTPSIEALLEDERPEMRFSAVWTLTKIGRANPERIAPCLTDGDEEVRLVAVECLAELGSTAHADSIAARLDDPSPHVQFAAALSLAALHDGRGASLLRSSLADADRRFDAAVALGDIQDDSSRGALVAIAKKRVGSPIHRAAAARALVRLGDPLGTTVIRKILRSWRIEARQYAVELVGELGLDTLVPDLARALRKSRAVDLPVYETALERLAGQSRQARDLLASVRGTHHPG
ncbi:MAG: HEAT repeat domain-containing protein [Myxococcota bacterium]